MALSFQTQKILIFVILIITFSICVASFGLSIKYHNNISNAVSDNSSNTEILSRVIVGY
jgi:hypothetical protein